MAEQLVPDEDDPERPELAQNAVAAIAYAVRTWLTDEAQEAAWAARQVYEAADLVVLRDQPDLILTAPRKRAGCPSQRSGTAGASRHRDRSRLGNAAQ